jgi:hypothetical protein
MKAEVNAEHEEHDGSGLALVRNYRNGGGRWETLIVPFNETGGLQEAIRKHNREVMHESIVDAVFLFADTMRRRRVSPEAIVSLATFLASKRTVTHDRVVDEWLNLKIWKARGEAHTNSNGGAFE